MKNKKIKLHYFAGIFFVILIAISSCEYYSYEDILSLDSQVSSNPENVNIIFDLSEVSDISDFDRIVVDISDENDNMILNSIEMKINSDVRKSTNTEKTIKFYPAQYNINKCSFIDNENNIFDGIAEIIDDPEGIEKTSFDIEKSGDKSQSIRFKCTPSKVKFVTDQSKSISVAPSIKGESGKRIIIKWGDSNTEIVSFTGKMQKLSHKYKNPGKYEVIIAGAINSLTEFVIDSAHIIEFDISCAKSLETFVCKHNWLTTIDLTKNRKLEYINLYNNQLQSLDVTKNLKLDKLIAGVNRLTAIDLTKNTKLTDFRCGSNLFTQIDFSKNKFLDTLTVCGNKIISVDISNNPNLIQVSFSKNQLKSIDITANDKLMDFTANFNKMNTDMVDQVISTLLISIIENNKRNGRFEITNNAIPSNKGLENVAIMKDQFGWKVLTDTQQSN